MVIFQEGGSYLGCYPIWRGADQPPYSRDDTEFLRATAPHIAHGLRVAQLIGSDAPPQRGHFVPLPAWGTGAILVDSAGRAIAMDSSARLIFHQISILDGANAFDSQPVRGGIDYLMGTVRAIFHGGGESWASSGAPVYRLYSHRTGIILKLRALRMIGTEGREYVMVLVERGETADARRRRMLARWGLSDREAEVLAFIAQNKTGPEIAILLGISHDTVRKHTVHIFEKLGVENRAAATSTAREFF